MSLPKTLICTVGVSLFYPNMNNLPSGDKFNEEGYKNWLKRQPEEDRTHLTQDLIEKLGTAYKNNKWKELAENLAQLPGKTRLCGAEINSITDLIEREYCAADCKVIFCHSETEDGRHIAEILQEYYHAQGKQSEAKEIKYLQDKEPKLFRTKGLRNLAKTISEVIREQQAPYCAINATGGYKAQIAIGVLMGQAIGVPVYYKHERFSEIIAFPPMPISMDFDLWLKTSGWLAKLDRDEMLLDVELEDLEDDWDEEMETLVEREIDSKGKYILELSPTGQIFYETFKGKFQSDKDQFLPPAVPSNQKQKPTLSDHSWGNARSKILNYLQKAVDTYPYVKTCHTDYWNPDLSTQVRFRLKGEEIEGIYSNGTWTVKFVVETLASTPGQRAACVADMNQNPIED